MLKYVCLLLFPVMCFGQESFPGAVQLKENALPAGIKIRGKIEEVWQWKDKLGDNILVTSVLGPYKTKSETVDMETNNIELFAAHYIKTDSGYKARWRLNDFLKDCELDFACNFLTGALTITDLDKDGVAETKLQYKMACHGDVSPSYMKLIMHEDSTKYALRGSMWIKGGSSDTICHVTEKNVNLEKLPVRKDDFEQYEQSMGRYETEKDFAKAPPAFIVFARREWLKYAVEKFDE